MDHIYNLLDGLIRPFNDDSKNFIRGYWHIVVQNLLTVYQRKDEHSLADSINYTQLNEKSFYWPFVPETESVTFKIESLPKQLSRGLYDLVCTGDPVKHEEDLELPTRIENAYNVSCESKNVIVDGSIVLGEGVHRVVWWSDNVEDFTFEDNVLNSEHMIHKVKATQGKSTSNKLPVIQCEMFMNNVLFTKSITTKYFRVGQPIRINNQYPDTIAEIIDTHRFRVSGEYSMVGSNVNVSIDVFPYAYPCEMETIPSFREGLLTGIDYYIKDSIIYFGQPVREPLIATRAYKPSTLIYDRFIRFLNEHPDSPSLYKVWWHDIFTGGLELFIHAAMGYPYTLPEMGRQKCIGFEYTREWGRGLNTYTRIKEYNRVKGVHSGEETSMRCEDGRMYKIVRHYPDGSMELDRTPHADSFIADAGEFCVSAIVLRNDVGKDIYIGVPAGAMPVVYPEETIDPWSKLTTGVRIFDKQDRSDYNDFEDVSRFVKHGPVSDDVLSMLAFNTFVIEVDSPFRVEDRLLRYLIPSWSQYHIKNRHTRIRLHDFSEISIAATLLFAKSLPFTIIPLTSSSYISLLFENLSLSEVDIPRKIFGKYNGSVISEIKDEFGNPFDTTLYNINYIANDNNDLADTLSEASIGYPSEGNQFVVTEDKGLNMGPDTFSYRFMAPRRRHVIMFTGHRGGTLTYGGDSIPRDIKRVDNQKWYFTEDGEYREQSIYYYPAVYSLGDSLLNDNVSKMEFEAGPGTILIGNKVGNTDMKRLGVRAGMFFKNNTDHIPVDSFTVHGEPILRSLPIHDTLTGVWGFYTLYVERDDAGTKAYFED